MIKHGIVLLAGLLCSTVLHADVVIIAHSSGPDSITENEVRDIYLNRSQQLPNGDRATAFELTAGTPIRSEFHNKITSRNDAQLKAFWSQQVFTGRGQPPAEFGTAAAMKASVSTTPGSIGYIDESDVDSSVKVILKP